MINRKIAPPVNSVSIPDFLMPEKYILSNGANVWYYNAPVSDISRISVIFHAGTIYETNKLQAFFAYQLLKQGSIQKSSQQVAEWLDFYGSYTEMEVMKDFCCFTIYNLNKYAKEILQMVAELIESPGFYETDFEVYRKKQKQRFLVNMEKVSGMARNQFPSLLFGKDHTYGGETNYADYDAIQLNDIKQFYNDAIKEKPFTVLVSGAVNNHLVEVIDNTLGKIKISALLKEISSDVFNVPNYKPQKSYLPKKEALQNAILIGTPLFNRKHPDYFPLMVANTLLGGYFGSRLMSNIREDKGYTYGIGSALATYKHHGYFIISTEVGSDVCADALKEIYIEIEKLCNRKVPEKELNVVKSYMLGDLLRDMDGPFALADRFKNMYINNLPDTYYPNFAEAIKNVNPDEILRVSQRYLSVENLSELVAGKR